MNTTPLVWGLLHGPQQGALDLRFETPAACADLLRAGEVDIGLVPVIELERQALKMLPGLGIASWGEVGSILVISKVPAREIKTLAVDSSSRTSVVLARILLAERFGSHPQLAEAPPDPAEMLRNADACLVIGDAALRVDRDARADWFVYDLGAEWSLWTGMPMVYAAWSARAGFEWGPGFAILRQSWEFGRERLEEIARAECGIRGISFERARDYLTRNIHFELSDDYMEGLALYRSAARSAGAV